MSQISVSISKHWSYIRLDGESGQRYLDAVHGAPESATEASLEAATACISSPSVSSISSSPVGSHSPSLPVSMDTEDASTAQRLQERHKRRQALLDLAESLGWTVIVSPGAIADEQVWKEKNL